MILADKIMTLRKKAGWSQEELAEKLGVTRQSISKYEGAQSIPDLDKILKLSEIFGVTTDYLIKDELEEEEYASSQMQENESESTTLTIFFAIYFNKRLCKVLRKFLFICAKLYAKMKITYTRGYFNDIKGYCKKGRCFHLYCLPYYQREFLKRRQ